MIVGRMPWIIIGDDSGSGGVDHLEIEEEGLVGWLPMMY